MARDGRRFLVGWFLFVLAGVWASMPSFAQAQQAADYITILVGNDVLLVDPSKVEMQTVPVADGLYVVEAVGENLGGNENIAVRSCGDLWGHVRWSPKKIGLNRRRVW